MNDVSAEKTFSVLCALCGYVRLCGLCGQYVGAWVTWLLVASLSTAIVVAQQPPASTPPKTPRAAAPVDLTGYWVSVITEDWRFRMVTPPKGDTASLPLNDAGTAAAKQWDPAKDIAAGEPCRAFGAAGIMRLPVRLRVTWQDDTTMRVDIDNGQQTRLFRFDRSTKPPAQPQWQGHSLAEWETVAQGQGVFGAGGNQLGSRRCRAAERLAQGDHDAHEAWVPSSQWYPVQRCRHADGVFRSHRRAQWRFVADSDVDRRGSDLSEHAVDAEYALQA